jgi:hypothetical protein
MAMSEHYRVAINTHLGKETVGSIRFAVSRGAREPEAETPTPAEPRVSPVALSEEERAQLDGMAGAIHSEPLRQAVVKAAGASLAWRKGLEKGRGG